MKNSSQKSVAEKILLVLYCVVAAIEIIAESFAYKPLVYVFKPLIPFVLMSLYWVASNKKNLLFFVVVTLAMITDFFFISNKEPMLFLGLLFLFINRMLLIYYINELAKIKDYIPLLIATIPFLFIFFYLLSISSVFTLRTYYIVIIQNILMSILAGIILAHYMVLYNKNSTWLYIFGLISVVQYLIVFLERYYLAGISPLAFRPLAMTLNTGVYFSFYKYIRANEKVKQ